MDGAIQLIHELTSNPYERQDDGSYKHDDDDEDQNEDEDDVDEEEDDDETDDEVIVENTRFQTFGSRRMENRFIQLRQPLPPAVEASSESVHSSPPAKYFSALDLK
jgi:hypothetical protein